MYLYRRKAVYELNEVKSNTIASNKARTFYLACRHETEAKNCSNNVGDNNNKELLVLLL